MPGKSIINTVDLSSLGGELGINYEESRATRRPPYRRSTGCRLQPQSPRIVQQRPRRSPALHSVTDLLRPHHQHDSWRHPSRGGTPPPRGSRPNILAVLRSHARNSSCFRFNKPGHYAQNCSEQDGPSILEASRTYLADGRPEELVSVCANMDEETADDDGGTDEEAYDAKVAEDERAANTGLCSAFYQACHMPRFLNPRVVLTPKEYTKELLTVDHDPVSKAVSSSTRMVLATC